MSSNTTITIFNRISLFIITGIIFLTIGSGTVSAWSTADIEAKLDRGVARAYGWDEQCKGWMRSRANVDSSLRNIINTGASYKWMTWLSERNRPNIVSPITVPYGATSVNLQVNDVTFLCASLVNNDNYWWTTDAQPGWHATGIADEAYRWVTPTNANDRPPNAVGSTNMRPARFDSTTRIEGFTVIEGGGNISGGTGSVLTSRRDPNSRYWFAEPVPVTYNSAPLTENKTVTVRMFFRNKAGYHAAPGGSGRVENCYNSSNNVISSPPLSSPLIIDQCRQDYMDLPFTIAVTDPPPRGAVEANNCTGVRGWAYDPSRSSQSILVNIYVDGVRQATNVPANRPHSGVNSTYGITGNHGFEYNWGDQFQDGEAHRVTVHALGIDASGNPNGSYPLIYDGNFGPCFDFELIPRTSSTVGSHVELGVVSITFRNSVDKSGGSRSRPIDLQARALKILPGDTSALPVTHTDNVTDNCSDPPWRIGGRCPQNYGAVSGHVFTGNGNIPAPGAVGTTVVDISNTSEYPIGTRVCANLALTPPNQTNNSWRWGSFHCVRIVAKPIVHVRGGDVTAGSPMTNAGVCGNAVPNASIVAWNDNLFPFRGSSTRYAAFALGRITGFATAIPSGANSAPRGLAFANTPASTGENYGGNFGQLPCIPDHFGTRPSNTVSVTNTNALNSNAAVHNNRSYFLDNSVGIGGITIGVGQHKAWYINGDLYITNNITYAGRGSWSTIDDIPALKLVVNGNIYIRSNVTQLDGVYIAQGSSDATGNIYTCATSMGNEVADIDVYSTCSTQLRVNGALVARKLHLKRSAGTLATNQTGERIEYLPELWLARWPSDGSSNAGGYDSITGLPPVL
jgi:hypothetical protein